MPPSEAHRRRRLFRVVIRIAIRRLSLSISLYHLVSTAPAAARTASEATSCCCLPTVCPFPLYTPITPRYRPWPPSLYE